MQAYLLAKTLNTTFLMIFLMKIIIIHPTCVAYYYVTFWQLCITYIITLKDKRIYSVDLPDKNIDKWNEWL